MKRRIITVPHPLSCRCVECIAAAPRRPREPHGPQDLPPPPQPQVERIRLGQREAPSTLTHNPFAVLAKP